MLALAIGLVLIWLGLHPFTTYPLSLRVLAWRRTMPVAQGTFSGSVAICVCAYNEEGVIAAKLRNLLSLKRSLPSLKILVYVDGATDRTAEILRSFEPAVRAVVSSERRGKTHGMNMLVAETNAELIVFSDANVLFDEAALPALTAPFADPAIGCVCGHLVYTSGSGSAMAATGSLYWRLEEFIKRLESATGSAMGADGSIFAIRRSLHEPPPADLIDDMYVSLAVLCSGHRIVCAADAIAYEEAVSRSREEFFRKQRIACQAFNVHRALWPRLIRLAPLDLYKYVSHKLLRWMAIYLLAIGCVLVLSGLALIGATAVAAALTLVGLAVLAILPLVRSGPLAALREVILAFVATGLGLARSLRGDRFQTWTPPASARRPALRPESASVSGLR